MSRHLSVLIIGTAIYIPILYTEAYTTSYPHLESCVHDIDTRAPKKPYTSEEMIANGQLF